MNCNLHFQALVLDGVYAPKAGGEPESFPLRAPETSDVLKVVERVAQRVPAMLKRRGLEPADGDGEDSDQLVCEDPWLAGVYAASVTGRIATGPQAGRRVVTGGDRVDPEEMESLSSDRCARVAGFSLHANVAVPARDRARLERLINPLYGPSAAGRRAPAAGPEIQPAAIVASSPETAVSSATPEINPAESATRHPRNYAWAELMRRVWEFDVLACECGGQLRIISAIHPPETTRKILDCLGLPSRPPPIAPAIPEPTLDSA